VARPAAGQLGDLGDTVSRAELTGVTQRDRDLGLAILGRRSRGIARYSAMDAAASGDCLVRKEASVSIARA
jgi:hypothetical protein